MSDLPMNPKPPGMSLPILSGPPKAKDPVCGMSVDPTKAAGKVAHNEKTYYFCSKRCEERFTQDPEKFLAAPGTAGMEHAHGHAHLQAHATAPVPVQARHEQMHPAAAAPAAAPASVPASAHGVRYTCPMDPEIVQIGPGVCPKCGMALEPMDVLAKAEADAEYEAVQRRFWVSAALSLPILLLSMFGEKLGLPLSDAVRNLVEFLL